MGDVFTEITPARRRCIEAQKMFFVASAPLAGDGRVNLSPKGTDSLRVLDARTVAYLDYVGSGVETIAHLRENGRIVVMFCAFAGPPTIVRLHGRGVPVPPADPRFAGLLAAFPGEPAAGLRSIIEVEVDRVSDSCGFQVPLMAYTGD